MTDSNRHEGRLFSAETWDAIQLIGEKLIKIPPAEMPDIEDGMTGDREPRNPYPRAPLSGAVAVELPFAE